MTTRKQTRMPAFPPSRCCTKRRWRTGGNIAAANGECIFARRIFIRVDAEIWRQPDAARRAGLIQRGVTTGCDDFFILTDVTAEALAAEKDPVEFKLRYRCPRKEVESGKVCIARSGDGSEHPIEAGFLLPEVQSLMHIEAVQIKGNPSATACW